MEIKKLISVIAMFALLFVICEDVIAAGGETETKGDFIYLKGTDTILEYIGTTGICEIPENTEVQGLQKQHSENTPITKLIINNGVTIKNSLSGEINRFDSLKEVILKEGVTEIPYQAFAHCNALEKIIIPSSVKKIGESAFSECKELKSIELPDGLEIIEDNAFSYLPLLSGDIIIPDSVVVMGYGVFKYCGDLDKVHISNNAEYNPTNFNGGEGVSQADWFYNTNVKEINIPDSVLENPVCSFNADEITFNSDMTVEIYNAVKNSSWYLNKYLKGKTDKSMGNFADYSIVQDTVLKYIGKDKNPVVPEGVRVIGNNAFSYCDIDTVTLPSSLETIDEEAFYYSTLKSIIIPESVKAIGDLAFDNCPYLEKMVIEGTPKIGLNAVVVTNVLTDRNITADAATMEKILENGIAEYDDLVSFYNIFNRQRKELGFAEITVPENEKLSKSAERPIFTDVSKTNEQAEQIFEPTVEIAPKILTVNADMSLFVSGREIDFPDAKPFIDENDRIQIPVRAVAEMLDCKVNWDGENKTVEIENDGNIVRLTIDSKIITVDNKPVQMDTAAIIRDNRTYLPVRFVAEALGLTVKWFE